VPVAGRHPQRLRTRPRESGVKQAAPEKQKAGVNPAFPHHRGSTSVRAVTMV